MYCLPWVTVAADDEVGKSSVVLGVLLFWRLPIVTFSASEEVVKAKLCQNNV